MAGTPVTRVGVIEAAPGLRVCDDAGREIGTTLVSFDHFR
jgi:thiamine-monophosphate kinase